MKQKGNTLVTQWTMYKCEIIAKKVPAVVFFARTPTPTFKVVLKSRGG